MLTLLVDFGDPGVDDRVDHRLTVLGVGGPTTFFFVFVAVPGSVFVEAILFDKFGASGDEEGGFVITGVVAAGGRAGHVPCA